MVPAECRDNLKRIVLINLTFYNQYVIKTDTIIIHFLLSIIKLLVNEINKIKIVENFDFQSWNLCRLAI